MAVRRPTCRTPAAWRRVPGPSVRARPRRRTGPGRGGRPRCRGVPRRPAPRTRGCGPSSPGSRAPLRNAARIRSAPPRRSASPSDRINWKRPPWPFPPPGQPRSSSGTSASAMHRAFFAYETMIGTRRGKPGGPNVSHSSGARWRDADRLPAPALRAREAPLCPHGRGTFAVSPPRGKRRYETWRRVRRRRPPTTEETSCAEPSPWPTMPTLLTWSI